MPKQRKIKGWAIRDFKYKFCIPACNFYTKKTRIEILPCAIFKSRKHTMMVLKMVKRKFPLEKFEIIPIEIILKPKWKKK